MKKNSENAKFGWKKIRIKWNLVLCNRNICGLLEHQSKGKKSIYLAATPCTISTKPPVIVISSSLGPESLHPVLLHRQHEPDHPED